MQYRSVVRGFKLSRLGLGCVQFGLDYGFHKKKTLAEVFSILDRARELGVTFLDTARDYGVSEEQIGQYHTERGVYPFTIATKLSRITKGMSVEKQVRESIEKSLTSLHLPSLDILLLHQTDPFIYSNSSFWKTMLDIKKKGLCRFFGISVYDPEPTQDLISKYADIIDVIQVPYNVFDQRFEKLFTLSKKKQVALIGRSVFLKGVIAAEDSEIPAELDGMKPFRTQLVKEAEISGRSVSELALLFSYQNSNLASTLVGVDSADELTLNVNTVNRLKLGPKTIKKLITMRVSDPFLIDPRRWRQL